MILKYRNEAQSMPETAEWGAMIGGPEDVGPFLCAERRQRPGVRLTPTREPRTGVALPFVLGQWPVVGHSSDVKTAYCGSMESHTVQTKMRGRGRGQGGK